MTAIYIFCAWTRRGPNGSLSCSRDRWASTLLVEVSAPADALREGRVSDQGTAGQQPATEQRDEFAAVAVGTPVTERPPRRASQNARNEIGSAEPSVL